uniref:leucine-rich repeat-containing G-protein coupled receptor 5-like n=1 Tax=Myxine glutinosa TaxID=7769 RepID=UPI00358EBCEC
MPLMGNAHLHSCSNGPLIPMMLLQISAAVLASTFPCPERCHCDPTIKSLHCMGPMRLAELPARFRSSIEQLHMSLSNESVLNRTAIGALPHLRAISLSRCGLQTFSEEALPEMWHLRKLDLSYNFFQHLPADFSNGLWALQSLILSSNHIVRLTGMSLKGFDSLEKLFLDDNGMTSIEPNAFGTLTRLRQLKLNGNRLVQLPAGTFWGLRDLEVLDLHGSCVKSLDDFTFAFLGRLSILALDHNNLTAINYKAFLDMQTNGVQLLFSGNSWVCDCDLQHAFSKMHATQHLALPDYANLRCHRPLPLQNHTLASVDGQLCIAETATVLVLALSVAITVIAAIAMAEHQRKRSSTQHWYNEEGQHG